MSSSAALPPEGWAPGFTCGDCPLWRSLAARDMAAPEVRVPRRTAHLVRPGQCRLMPRPVYNVQFGLETWVLVDAAEPGCASSPLYKSDQARRGKAKSAPGDAR